MVAFTFDDDATQCSSLFVRILLSFQAKKGANSTFTNGTLSHLCRSTGRAWRPLRRRAASARGAQGVRPGGAVAAGRGAGRCRGRLFSLPTRHLALRPGSRGVGRGSSAPAPRGPWWHRHTAHRSTRGSAARPRRRRPDSPARRPSCSCASCRCGRRRGRHCQFHIKYPHFSAKITLKCVCLFWAKTW